VLVFVVETGVVERWSFFSLKQMALAVSEQLLPWPEYRRLSRTPDSNHQINCKIRDCKWHQCD
jgi:hypothetical protein